MESTIADLPKLGDRKTGYNLRTEHFDGPLELLLDLIEKRKLFIGDFALSAVADEYIAYIRKFENFPMGEVANFLLVASTLVLIKSKSLLPELNLSQEEEESIDELKRRLAMLELFRKLGGEIRTRYGKEIIYERSGRPEAIVVFTPDKKCTIDGISGAIRSVVTALPKAVALPRATIRKVVSLEEMMDRLAHRVTQALKTKFSEFSKYAKGRTASRDERVEIIVSFLAMLELVKQGIVRVAQAEQHGDIDIETHKFDTPTYT